MGLIQRQVWRRRLGAEGRCRSCDHRWLTKAKDPMCPVCKSRDIELESGLENLLPYFLGRLLYDMENVEKRLDRIEKRMKKIKRGE